MDFLFLSAKIDFLEEITMNSTIPKLGDFADVEVGITAAQMNFYVPLALVEAFELQPLPALGWQGACRWTTDFYLY
jgi:hypothetical protein